MCINFICTEERAKKSAKYIMQRKRTFRKRELDDQILKSVATFSEGE